MATTASLAPNPAPTATAPGVFRQLGLITRQLHDTLEQLGVMPTLRQAADSLPDARSRLDYVAIKSGDAAHKVLNSVDQAKAEHRLIADQARRLADAIRSDPVRATAAGAMMSFVRDIEAATSRIDQHLTDIMMAQDFHDLTGQVMAKVVGLAADLELSLVQLLVQAAPPEPAPKVESPWLNGPVFNSDGRANVVSTQTEADELLASLGF